MFLYSDNQNHSRYGSYLAVLIMVSLINALGSNFSHAQTITENDIVGAWEVYKDDDKPGQDMPKEIMNFWNDGKFSISGESPHIGLYRISGNKLQLLVKIGDKAMPVERAFQLTEHELRFKNKKNGWVYYRRINDKPSGNPPDL